MSNDNTQSSPQRDPDHGHAVNGVQVREGVLAVPGELKLHFGGTLESVSIAWRIAGPAGAPVVVAMGGISASRRVWLPDEPRGGWWHEVVGPGLALDTQRFRILSFDYLGASADSTGPRDGAPFPRCPPTTRPNYCCASSIISASPSLRAIAGASYGGMVALAFGERYPDRVARLIVISAADRAHPMASAWRVVQRRIVKFAIESGKSGAGSRAGARARDGDLPQPRGIRGALRRRRAAQGRRPIRAAGRGIPVRARRGVRAALSAGIFCLSVRIDRPASRGRRRASSRRSPRSRCAKTSSCRSPTCARWSRACRNAELHEISSVYGHDAFLKENRRLAPIFANVLE